MDNVLIIKAVIDVNAILGSRSLKTVAPASVWTSYLVVVFYFKIKSAYTSPVVVVQLRLHMCVGGLCINDSLLLRHFAYSYSVVYTSVESARDSGCVSQFEQNGPIDLLALVRTHTIGRSLDDEQHKKRRTLGAVKEELSRISASWELTTFDLSALSSCSWVITYHTAQIRPYQIGLQAQETEARLVIWRHWCQF